MPTVAKSANVALLKRYSTPVVIGRIKYIATNKEIMTVNIRIDQLQALWLRQLYHEHEDICLSHNVDLPTPIFEITDSLKIFGRWHTSSRILSLSRHLILHHPWSVVLQVLKHEMAHQLCAFLHGGGTAHGLGFQEACERLGVLPEFRRPGVVVPEMVEAAAARSELSENGRKCLAKIEKLLALGRSANEHEAALAMEKANELLEKYHLQGLEEGGEHRYACVVIDRKKKKDHRLPKAYLLDTAGILFCADSSVTAL